MVATDNYNHQSRKFNSAEDNSAKDVLIMISRFSFGKSHCSFLSNSLKPGKMGQHYAVVLFEHKHIGTVPAKVSGGIL